MIGRVRRVTLGCIVCFAGALLLLLSNPARASVTVFNNENGGAVSNNPTGGNPQLTLSQYSKIDYIRTYHWNNGRGAPLGRIWLQGGPNNLQYGPWQSTAYAKFWVVEPVNIYLPAGTYTVFDSDPATWSHNSQTGGKGFALVNATAVDLNAFAINDVKGRVELAHVRDRLPVTNVLLDDKKGPVQSLMGFRPYPSVTVDRPTIGVGQVATVKVANPYPGWNYYFESSGPGPSSSPSSGPLMYQLQPSVRGTYTVIVKTKIGTIRSVPPTEMGRVTITVQ
jgi:hypothetical protein